MFLQLLVNLSSTEHYCMSSWIPSSSRDSWRLLKSNMSKYEYLFLWTSVQLDCTLSQCLPIPMPISLYTHI